MRHRWTLICLVALAACEPPPQGEPSFAVLGGFRTGWVAYRDGSNLDVRFVDDEKERVCGRLTAEGHDALGELEMTVDSLEMGVDYEASCQTADGADIVLYETQVPAAICVDGQPESAQPLVDAFLELAEPLVAGETSRLTRRVDCPL